VGILGSTEGLLRITLPRQSREGIFEQLGISPEQATRSPHRFRDLMERLVAYFAGHRVDFPDRLDLSAVTAFRRKVWMATRLIPYGETRSYTWVAQQVEKPKAVRAVGQALGSNPLPVIIPCHRVLASNGELGGFSGGLEMKRFLLHLEAATGS
jgi:methylated-DNA-[protein]-cysteine S-methyltransferase